MSYDNTNTFIFSKNEKKTEDKHPDWTGTLNVDGVEFFLDGWIKERKDGSGKFISGKIKRKNKQPGGDQVENFKQAVDQTFGRAQQDPDIPF